MSDIADVTIDDSVKWGVGVLQEFVPGDRFTAMAHQHEENREFCLCERSNTIADVDGEISRIERELYGSWSRAA